MPQSSGHIDWRASQDDGAELIASNPTCKHALHFQRGGDCDEQFVSSSMTVYNIEKPKAVYIEEHHSFCPFGGKSLFERLAPRGAVG